MPRTWSEFNRPALWAALALLILAQQAGAKPKYIEFAPMVKDCEVIAVARFAGEIVEGEEGGTVELELTRVVKGNVEPGKHKVVFFDIPTVDPKAREFVAFFGKGMKWEFVAVPIAGNRLSDSVLRVYGFYNTNAYWVSPGLITLAQIERFVKDGTLAYTFRGPLCFPQRGDAAWRASALEIEVSYDAVAKRAEVRGLPELEGFPTRPEVYITSGHREDEVVLTYSRHGDRPLEIHGRVQAAGESGEMLTKFFVQTPDLPTREAFEGYLSDPKQGPTSYTVRLTCTPRAGESVPRILTLTMNKERGTMPEIAGWAETPLQIASFSGGGQTRRTGSVGLPGEFSKPASVGGTEWSMTASAKLEDGRELSLRFDRREEKKGPDIFRWTFQEWLLYDLLVEEIPGKVFLDGKEVGTFVASLGEIRDAESGHLRPIPEAPAARGVGPLDRWAIIAVGGIVAAAVAVVWIRSRRARRRTIRP